MVGDVYRDQVSTANDIGSWFVTPLGEIVDTATGTRIVSKYLGPAGQALDAYDRYLDDGYSPRDFIAQSFGLGAGLAAEGFAGSFFGPYAGIAAVQS